MKTISAEMQAHLDSSVTTLCTCWRLERTDGVVQGFTSHVQDILYEGVLYEAATGFTPSSIASTEDLKVDNLEIMGLLDSSAIHEDDLLAGVYDGADVYIFMVNYKDLTMGDIKLKYGTLGEVRSGQVVFEAELRGLSDKLQQTIGEVYSVTCRADLGDSRCGLNIRPTRWAPHTLYAAGDVIRATFANHTNRQFTCTTGGYSGSTEPSWNTTLAATTNGVSVGTVTDGAFANALGINWFGAAEWSIVGGVASCDGTQAANSTMYQAASLLAAGVPYDTSFDVANLTAGQVRIVVGGVAGTWRTADGTFTETITAGSGTDIAIEADTNFVGDIDNVSVDEQVTTVWETEASYTAIGAITTVNSNENFVDTSRTEIDGFFDQGFITFTSGANAGKSMEIKTFASNTFQLALPMPYDVAVTDTYDVTPGCDKTLDTCRDVYDNVVNFRGEPHIPGIDEITKFGGQ